MSGFLVLAAVVVYITIGLQLVTPAAYRRMAGRITDTYGKVDDGFAKWLSFWTGVTWPIAVFIVASWARLHRIDERTALSKKERDEYERLRAEALKELG